MIWLADIIGASGRFRFVRAKFNERRKNEINPRSEPIHLFSLRVGQSQHAQLTRDIAN
jgi:hypothetical protein